MTMIKNLRSVIAVSLLSFAPALTGAASSALPAGAAPILASPAATPAGTVNIRLIDAAGGALAGWRIHCPHFDSREMRAYAGLRRSLRGKHTDKDGRMNVDGVPLETNLQLIATHDSIYVALPVIRLTADQPVRPLEWSVSEAQLFTARVVNPDGAPIVAAEVSLSLRLERKLTVNGESPTVSHTGLGTGFSLATNAQGEFSLPLNFTVPGVYELKVNPRKDWQPAKIEIDRNASLPGQIKIIKLLPGHVLSGRVLDGKTKQPVPGVELFAMHDLPSYGDTSAPAQFGVTPLAEAKTDHEGRFRFSTFPSGHFRIFGVEPVIVTLPASSDVQIELIRQQ